MIWTVMHRQNADSLILEHNDAVMLRLPLLLEKPALNRRIPSPKLTSHDIPVTLLMQTLRERPVSVGCSFQGVSHRLRLTMELSHAGPKAQANPRLLGKSKAHPALAAVISLSGDPFGIQW